MNNAIRPLVIAVAIAIALNGCATSESVTRDVDLRSKASVQNILNDRNTVATVTSDDGIHISAIPVEYIAPIKGSVTMRAQDIALSVALGGLAEGAALSISYNSGVDLQRPLAIDFRDMDPKTAIREAAMAGGYVAVFDRPNGVTISKEGAYTFRVPARVLETLSGQYSISNASSSGQQGSSSSGGSSSGSSSSGGTGSSGQPTNVQVRISGSSSITPQGLKAFLSTMSGAQISLLPEDGLITARGTAPQLRRIGAFIDQYVRDALTQVDVELSIVEVGLLNEFQSGIDWTRVIPKNTLFGTALGSVSLRTGLIDPSQALTIRSTSNSIDSIVQALEKITTVNELSRPRLIAMNHSMKMFRSTLQRPYLPSATTNTQTGGISNNIQNSASVSYTEDGIAFSVLPHVIDSHFIELKLLPVLTSTQAQATFPIGRDIILTAPIQQRQDAHLDVIAEHGKTMVIGGLRTAAGNSQASGLPGGIRIPGVNLLVGGHNDRSHAREVVMLLHTRIIPPPKVSSLVAESI